VDTNEKRVDTKGWLSKRKKENATSKKKEEVMRERRTIKENWNGRRC
jgi:hypothetical protein